MITLIALLIIISPIVFAIYAHKAYKTKKRNEKVKGKDAIILLTSLALSIVFCMVMFDTNNDTANEVSDNDTTTVEEPVEDTDTEEQEESVNEPVKPDPIDTSNIYVYVSLYNGNEVYGNHAHEDYNCVFCKKEFFGDPLDVVKVNAKEFAGSNSKYEHIGFCPYCSHYSDYYINGDPK